MSDPETSTLPDEHETDGGHDADKSATPDAADTNRDRVEHQLPSKSTAGQTLPSAPAARPGLIARIFTGRDRRDQQVQALQAGYVEMLDMMRSIRGHLDRQADSQDRLVQTLHYFPDAVEGLSNIGKATEQQVQVLDMVRSQLEMNAQYDREIVGSMNGFNQTLSAMDQTSRHTTAAVGDLVESTRAAEEELRAMLERSERRQTFLIGILGSIGLLAIGGAIYVGLTQRQAFAPARSPSPSPFTAPAVDVPAEQSAPIDTLLDAAIVEKSGAPDPGGWVPAESIYEENSPEILDSDVPGELEQTQPDEQESAGDSIDQAAGPEGDLILEESAAPQFELIAPDEPVMKIRPAAEWSPPAKEANSEEPATPSAQPKVLAAPDEPTADSEPEGVKNVVRRLFSFLGDEEPDTAAVQDLTPSP